MCYINYKQKFDVDIQIFMAKPGMPIGQKKIF